MYKYIQSFFFCFLRLSSHIDHYRVLTRVPCAIQQVLRSYPFYIQLFYLFTHTVMSNSLITPWTAECQASLSFTVSQILLKLMSIESMMPSNHLVLSHPLLIITSIYLRFKVFSNESALPIRRPKYWSFSFSISSANEYSGLISFRADCLYVLTVQWTLQRLLQHHDAKE